MRCGYIVDGKYVEPKITLKNMNTAIAPKYWQDMNKVDFQYYQLLQDIQNNGTWQENRTGINTKSKVGFMFQHNMSEGFPMLGVKRVPFKMMSVELEGFIKGITDKEWYQENGCTIWSDWCNPKKVAYGTDKATKDAMMAEKDLGRIYGAQWRDFQGKEKSVDQLAALVTLLKRDPTSRRAIVSAWNPTELDQMALPPCHVMFQVTISGRDRRNNKFSPIEAMNISVNGNINDYDHRRVNLTWYQRSVDVPLGLPFNIASYGLLLLLISRDLGIKPGILTGMLNDVHYYENQEKGVDTILRRYEQVCQNGNYLTDSGDSINLNTLPTLTFEGDVGNKSVLNWTHKYCKLSNYNPLPKIDIPIAV